MEEEKKPLRAATEPPSSQVQEIEEESGVKEEAPSKSSGGGGGGWGGWGFSAFSVLSDLQKAAEEISRNVCVLYLFSLRVQRFLIFAFWNFSCSVIMWRFRF